MEAETVEREDNSDNSQDKRHHYSTDRFSANWQLVAATQLFGESQKAGEIITGFLDLAPSAFRNQWWVMEKELGVEHEIVANANITKNLKDAIKNKTTFLYNGKVPLTVSFDMAWQKRGKGPSTPFPGTNITKNLKDAIKNKTTFLYNGKVLLTVLFDMAWQKRGRSFNSLSGHAFLIDVVTGKIIAMQVYSKQCHKCCDYMKKGLSSEQFPEHKCPKNYEGSSKGMEATAALEMVKRLFENELVQSFVTETVIDDDASTRALLTRCLRKLAEFVVGFEWPVDSNGKKVPKSKDVGRLPVDHPVIKFLADLMHQIRCFGRYVFGLANAPQSTSTCSMVDTYRLKRNFGYCLLSYHTSEFDIFQEKSKAVLEHHFNNHTHCDDWCAMKKVDATQAVRGNLKYRCKKEHPKLYKDLCQIVEHFTETEKLRECHHGYSSQKNESLNRLISQFVPKDRTYCQSMSLTSRICLAVGIDSGGHKKYYQCIFDRMNTSLPSNTRTMLLKMKTKREYDRKYQALPKRKRKRSESKFSNMRDGMKKQMAGKAVGLAYDTGMNMEENGNQLAGEKSKRKITLCKFCGASTHKTRRAQACKYYGWSDDRVQAEIVCINISRATEEAAGVATGVGGSDVQSEGTCDLFGSCCDMLRHLQQANAAVLTRPMFSTQRNLRDTSETGTKVLVVYIQMPLGNQSKICRFNATSRNIRARHYGF
jgi:hypothetical protein